jgi:hypothetical protein
MLTDAKPLSLKTRLMLIGAAGVMTAFLFFAKQDQPPPATAWAAPAGYADVAAETLPDGGTTHLWVKPAGDGGSCHLLEGRHQDGSHNSTVESPCSERFTAWGLERGLGVLVVQVPHRDAATVEVAGASVPVHDGLAMLPDRRPEERPLRLTAVAKDATGAPLGPPGELFLG